MDFWNTLSSGLDRFADKLDEWTGNDNAPLQDSSFDMMDKAYCWEDLDFAGEFTMQRHVVSGQCRIIDKFGAVVERGTQSVLEQSMIRRSAQAAVQAKTMPVPASASSFAMPSPAAVVPTSSVQAMYGDIIGVVRKNGAFTHYGIYVSDTCVVHYAIPASVGIGHATIHATSLRLFLRDATDYFILDFPKPYQPPVVLGNDAPHNETIAEQLARNLQQHYGYHLYTPEETVKRARSRIGETHYNLLTNNCEHFAIWCKTGVSESLQISEMLASLTNAAGFHFHRPFKH